MVKKYDEQDLIDQDYFHLASSDSIVNLNYLQYFIKFVMQDKFLNEIYLFKV